MSTLAHVIFRDFNRHICFIRMGTSAVGDRKFPRAHLQFECGLRLGRSRDTCGCCQVAPTAQGSMKKDDQP
jgi:hypothetical protein